MISRRLLFFFAIGFFCDQAQDFVDARPDIEQRFHDRDDVVTVERELGRHTLIVGFVRRRRKMAQRALATKIMSSPPRKGVRSNQLKQASTTKPFSSRAMSPGANSRHLLGSDPITSSASRLACFGSAPPDVENEAQSRHEVDTHYWRGLTPGPLWCSAWLAQTRLATKIMSSPPR